VPGFSLSVQRTICNRTDLESNEAPHVTAGNPHQLMRVLEVHDILTCARMIVTACEARKASSAYLHFNRLDYPVIDPAEWHKWIVIARRGQEVTISHRPIAFWGDFESNYGPRHAENIKATQAGQPTGFARPIQVEGAP
jgi:hypothetical protein